MSTKTSIFEYWQQAGNFLKRFYANKYNGNKYYFLYD